MTSPRISVHSKVELYTSPPSKTSKKDKFEITIEDFIDFDISEINNKKTKRKTKDVDKDFKHGFLLIGFDTEYKTPDYLVNKSDIHDGKAKYDVLSYQFHAKFDDGEQWCGICIPEEQQRISLGEFIVFCLGSRPQSVRNKKLPFNIYLVGHFLRADVPAFSDFKSQTSYLSSVRGTFSSIDLSTPVMIIFNDNRQFDLNIYTRDTMLLTPQSSKSLKELGKLVGIEKVELNADRNIAKYMISNMDKVREENWLLFRKYALTDAEICLKYIEKVIDQYHAVTGKTKVPVTLTSIGVDLLIKSWKEKHHLDEYRVVGKEKVKDPYYSKTKATYIYRPKDVPQENLSHHLDFITESYHGGRNEQFWFGPGFDDIWLDIDLSSAYPTAMSLIGLPEWKQIDQTKNIDDFDVYTLGFAWVDFRFPDHVRFPTLPVRTPNGLIFPLEGRSYCSSPELIAAQNLGCEIKLIRGVIVPTDRSKLIFGDFIKECIEKRNKAGSKSLEGLFWKEISNSTYGKTAQGLRMKRVYDMRDSQTKPLPPSRVTNPCYASYITSFVRALIGEIINTIPEDKIVFSCTTDGFLTNLPEDKIDLLSKGPLAQVYATARQLLVGDPKIVEIKHKIKNPLGWKTRGQATLKQITGMEDDPSGTVLAKGGIFTKPEFEATTDQNNEIVRMFFNRKPDQVIHVESMVGLRDIIEHDADLVQREITKRLNMEFDWKRCSIDPQMSEEYNHIYFNTKPWKRYSEFDQIREAWTKYTKNDPKVIKNMDDFSKFEKYVEIDSFKISHPGMKVKKQDPDIKRLRLALCSAWKHSQAGLTKEVFPFSASSFAKFLGNYGIPCKKSDVEYGFRRTFEPHMVPPTDTVISILHRLKKKVPQIDSDLLLYKNNTDNSINLRGK